MMIAHISDTHLGSMPYSIRERAEDFYEEFSEAVDLIIKEGAEVVVHSGDIFDSPKPPGLAVNTLYEGLTKLKDKGIKFLYVLGEHDISRVRDMPFPYLMTKMGLAVYLGGNGSFSVKDVTFYGFNKHRRSEVEALMEKLKSLNRSDGKNVLVLHQGLYEFNQYAGEISASDLPPWFDYYAFGHIHEAETRRISGLKGPISYAGSTDESAGFNLVDLSGEEAVIHRIPLESSRKTFRFSVKYEEVESFVQEALRQVSGLKKKPMVFVKVFGKNINRAKVNSYLNQLREASLLLQVKFEEEEEVFSLQERPSDIKTEMIKQAEKILGKEGVFAVSELLPLSEDPEDLAERLWKAFESGELDD